MSGRASRMMRDGALWGSASALVLALHLGGALWIMHEAEAAAPPGLPEPVFIDLAPPDQVAAAEPQEEVAEPDPEPEPEPEPQPEPEPEPQPEPEPEQITAPLDLPPLPQLQPLEDMADLFPQMEAPPDLSLQASTRPSRRPEPEPEPEPEREPDPEPRRQAEPKRERKPEPQPQAPRQAEARRVDAGQRTTGTAGVSAQQRARDEASWKQQVGVCILRSASRVSGARGSRGVVNLVIARNGRVQSAALSGSTGDARVDREISRAMGRARCPSAPPSLTNAAYNFQQPFAIQ